MLIGMSVKGEYLTYELLTSYESPSQPLESQVFHRGKIKLKGPSVEPIVFDAS